MILLVRSSPLTTTKHSSPIRAYAHSYSHSLFTCIHSHACLTFLLPSHAHRSIHCRRADSNHHQASHCIDPSTYPTIQPASHPTLRGIHPSLFPLHHLPGFPSLQSSLPIFFSPPEQTSFHPPTINQSIFSSTATQPSPDTLLPALSRRS